MALEIKHAYVAVGTNAGNGEVAKEQWNAALATSMATSRLLGRTTAGAGAIEELDATAVKTLLGLNIPLAGFRNKVINGDFDHWQRATSQTADGYGSADRWRFTTAGGSTQSVSRIAFQNGQTEVPGNPTYCVAVTATSAAGGLVRPEHRIEDVRTLAGKVVTMTFWASANAAKNIYVRPLQSFGTGGSGVAGQAAQACALTTGWQKFTRTFTLGSMSGKTIGAGSFLALEFYLDAHSGYGAYAQQSGTFYLAHVSLVEGDATAEADPFSPRHIQQELALCQRYFCKTYEQGTAPGTIANPGRFQLRYVSATSVGNVAWMWQFPVNMRAIPTVVLYSPLTGASGKIGNPTTGDIDGAALNPSDRQSFLYNTAVAAATGDVQHVLHATADAEL